MSKNTLTPEVRAVLEACTFAENRLYLPQVQLKRPLYEAVNKHIDACGGKWKGGKVKAHVFPADVDPRQAIGLVLEQGHSVDEKKLFQAFHTPETAAADVVAMADVKPYHRVLEPSAGDGALIKEILAQGGVMENLFAVEINPKSAVKLPGDLACFVGDFLEINRFPFTFDRIVMNPPFTKNQDTIHVMHALKFLRAGGRLVAIMAGNTTRAPFQRILDRVKEMNGHHHVTKLPEGSFKESGTNVNTIVLSIQLA